MGVRWATLALLLAGCKLTGTAGENNVATFQFANCILDCKIDKHSIAAGGARTRILVKVSGARTWVRAESSKESVARFTKSGDGVDVESGEAGTTDLKILDDRGFVVDRVEVRVENAARLGFEKGWTGAGPLLLGGAQSSFSATPVRSDGDDLIGGGALGFSVSGSLTFIEAPPLQDRVFFLAEREGAGQVDTTCPGVSLALPVEVIPPSAVARIKFARGSYARGIDGYFDVAVDIRAESASGEPIFGAACEWTTTGTVLGIQRGTPTQIGDGEAKTRDEFKVPAQNGAGATCTIGAATASLPL